MNVEFHGQAGFSLLLFSDEQAIGVMASTQSKMSVPSVYVCLGGQVIEKWPRELFLPRMTAEKTISQFLSQAASEPAAFWIRLDRFPRETVHSGGKGLIALWSKLSAQPQFPFEPAKSTA